MNTTPTAENDAPLNGVCTCEEPAPTLMGECAMCGGFACMYAGMGRRKCPSWRCDCFIDTHPDSPMALHPEAFTVTRVIPPEVTA